MSQVSYEQIMRAINSQKMVTVSKYGEPPRGAFGALAPDQIKKLPPMNTNISVAGLDKYEILPEAQGVFAQRPPPPETWNWRDTHEEDDEDIVAKKRLIEGIRNQYHCGSCWAISTAQIVGDMFVASGLVDYKPNLSTTYIVSNFQLSSDLSSGGCNGGWPAALYNSMITRGIASNHCVDYYWCKNNPSCNPDADSGDGGSEFLTDGGNLNNLIPPSGCFFPDNKKLYLVKNVQVASTLDAQDANRFQLEMKHHIMVYGPACAAYVVYDNFVQGDFSATGGIYIDTVDYSASTPGNIVEAYNPNILGGHAVAVIGWGISDEEIDIGRGTKSRIPYWYVRNTWGSNWGTDNGYFKIAMFPINQSCGFDYTINIQGAQIGGFVVAEAASIQDDKIDKTIPTDLMPTSHVDFFKEESNITTTEDDTEDEQPDTDDTDDKESSSIWGSTGMKIFLGVLAGLLVGLIIWFIISKLYSETQSFKSYRELMPRVSMPKGFRLPKSASRGPMMQQPRSSIMPRSQFSSSQMPSRFGNQYTGPRYSY